MSTLMVLIAALAVFFTLSLKRCSLMTGTVAMAGVTLLSILTGAGVWLTCLLLIPVLITGLLSVDSLRRKYLSKPVFIWFKSVLPELSETEREAIDAGTVWWDGELFSGTPGWQKLLSMPKPELTAEEQAFIDGPVKELCAMVDNWDINHNTSVIPQQVEKFIKDNGFLGMIIPQEYGGLNFSGVAQTEIISLLGSTGGCVANYITVPNSLGPGELLIKYGTQAQKNYYLPRLASGKEVPCFALTGPLAGSDATSLPDTGVICEGEFEGEKVLGISLNFKKRYITLAPVATLIGLAFRLEDPNHLLGDVDDYGITCALIPRNTDGVTIGRRHKPVGDAFLNGPIEGKNVFVPLDYIIGGPEMAGKGWTMLVNCLSVGRCITLPSISTSLSKHMLLGTTAYSALRQQFGMPIAMFEGVQKPLARIIGLTYLMNAARLHTAQSLAYGEKPSVASAIVKYHLTEMARQVAIDAMDIHGGKAIMTGPKNYVADAYCSIPIAITVEGANIMTRNLMIFGQGATRSHPYVLKEMQLAAGELNAASVSQFDELFFGHVGYSISNAARALVLGMGGGRFARSPGNRKLAKHYRDLNRLSAAFALIADVSMLTMQSKLKFKEMLSARLGDLLSHLYLASMVLKHYESEGCPLEEYPVVEWVLRHQTHQYQIAMQEILHNYPGRVLAAMLRFIIFPLGARYNSPGDHLDTHLVKLFTRASETRARLLKGTFDQNLPNNPVGHVNAVFLKSLELAPLHRQIREAVKAGQIEKALGSKQIDLAKQAGVISESQAQVLYEFDQELMKVINVDHFDETDLIRNKHGAAGSLSSEAA